ncbi:prepilin-type N-terminal cleavage/methylation domain-containing protein [Halobacillus fulvus]|nr:prepilin-type N-terminal cleavage/methylation domain-containing protein [Halobacillus fulvus]
MRLQTRHLVERKNGFTLSEVLIVLSAWLLLLLILTPLHHSTYTALEDSYFLKQFESDVLLTQHYTMNDHPQYQLLFFKAANEYVLYNAKNQEAVFRRPLPSHWRYQMDTMQSKIQFNANGTIRNPGTMRWITPEATYRVVFPFGTSRFTIEKQ